LVHDNGVLVHANSGVWFIPTAVRFMPVAIWLMPAAFYFRWKAFWFMPVPANLFHANDILVYTNSNLIQPTIFWFMKIL
jgi:hypothetical protein